MFVHKNVLDNKNNRKIVPNLQVHHVQLKVRYCSKYILRYFRHFKKNFKFFCEKIYYRPTILDIF